MEALFQLNTNRKWQMANRMVTSSMTSRDLKRWRSWAEHIMFGVHYLENGCRCNGAPIGNDNRAIKWLLTWSMTSRNPKRSRSCHRYIWMQIARKRSEIEAQFQWNTNTKLHMVNRMVTCPMTSRDSRSKSRSRCRCIWISLCRKSLDIVAQFPRTTMIHDVTWP